MLQQRASPQESVSDILETQVTCIRMACNIIQEYKQVPQESTASAFPFIHSLVGATVVALGLIIREPSFKAAYSSLTLHAASSLENYCRKTWVSGKMIRTIRRLNQMASFVLSDSKISESSRPHASIQRSLSISHNTNPTPRSTTWPAHTSPHTTYTGQGHSAATDGYNHISLPTNLIIQSPNSLGPFHQIVLSTNSQQTAEGRTITPTNLVTTDFDFEQTLAGDLIQGGQSPGWATETGLSEIPNDGMAYMAMGWLESLFGTDPESNIILSPEGLGFD
jgi:hypothetical protein